MSNTRTRTGLTGLRQTDMLILQQLRDDELDPVCRTSEYLKSICDDPIFWYNRINNKLKPSMDTMIKHYPNLREQILEMGFHEHINEITDMLGFNTLQELSAFMDELPSPALTSVFGEINKITADIKKSYIIDRELLPKYINYDELWYQLRRDFIKSKYRYINTRAFDVPTTIIKNSPGFTRRITVLYMNVEMFNRLKLLGVKY